MQNVRWFARVNHICCREKKNVQGCKADSHPLKRQMNHLSLRFPMSWWRRGLLWGCSKATHLGSGVWLQSASKCFFVVTTVTYCELPKKFERWIQKVSKQGESSANVSIWIAELVVWRNMWHRSFLHADCTLPEWVLRYSHKLSCNRHDSGNDMLECGHPLHLVDIRFIWHVNREMDWTPWIFSKGRDSKMKRIPSGNFRVFYWTWPLKTAIFHSYVNVYQRVYQTVSSIFYNTLQCRLNHPLGEVLRYHMQNWLQIG